MTRLGLLSAALLAGSLVLAASANAQGDVAAGETVFEANCAECHENPGRIARRVEGADDAAKTAFLEGFLPDHFAEDAAERADVIAYLLSL